MRFLLDTHVAIWSVWQSHLVPAATRRMLSQPDAEAFVSAASIWEISIKFNLRKASAPPASGTESLNAFTNANMRILQVTGGHAAAVDLLPDYHGDPFDRLIVAQALSEPMRLITRDRKLLRYSDKFIELS